MAECKIEDYRLIATSQLVRAIKEGKANSERFCFIIGAGASESSGIPTGRTLEHSWMEEMEREPGLEEIREIALRLKEDGHLDHSFDEIEKAWNTSKREGIPLPSEFYFDIYKLRFFPNHRNGYHYLEKIMAGKKPSFGYHTLALILADGGGNNLVITTNFDNLVEDALFLYTENRPLVINHELLAEFAGDSNIKRPIIAKIHRGIFFDPLNRPEDTNELKGKWHDVLVSVFQCYTPIVIGYGGGDNSLMNLLEEETVKMKNGIYWCYVEKYGLPPEKIQRFVEKKKGYLVRTAGFDATMLAIGNALFPDKIGVHETEEYLRSRINTQIENYEKEYKKLTEFEESGSKMDERTKETQSAEEFLKEIQKLIDRDTTAVQHRKESGQMTPWDYRRQGGQYCDSGEYGQAVECFSMAIKHQPDIALFYNDRGYAHSMLGQYEEALADYDKAIELRPDYADAYNNRGCTYDDLGQYEKALADYNKAIELRPDDADAYNNRGCTYDNLGQYEKALADYNKAIELRPDNAGAYNNRGYTYNNLSQHEKALADFDKAIELSPDDAEAYNNRGCTYKDLGQHEKALADFDKAIKLSPDDAEAYNNRGCTYKDLGQHERALADFKKAIELKPNYANPYKHAGMVWAKLKDSEKAIHFLTKAIELNPKYKDAYLGRADVYRSIGEEEKATADEAIAKSL